MSFATCVQHRSGLNDSDLDSSGCDMSMDSHLLSPIPYQVPRRLNFDEEMDNMDTPGPKSKNVSTPYKRMRALRLFDNPLTPKTIYKKSTSSTLDPKCRLFSSSDKFRTSRAIPSVYCEDKPAANVNPFTPHSKLVNNKKRTHSTFSPVISSPKSGNVFCLNLNGFDIPQDAQDFEIEQPTKRVALTDSNISRYHQEFLEVELIGSGQFGSVYKCINRLDGCTYAVKKSIKPVAGSAFENMAFNEVYAHAVLGRHQHVVRYYSAWAEDNHMIIQNEYCNSGSLSDKIAQESLSAVELRRLLRHVAEGLRYIHSENLVHMDIKPGNIFINMEKRVQFTNYDSKTDGFDEPNEHSQCEEELTYKIGDLGLVTSLSNPLVEEGDCRYLPLEILQEDYSHLTKSDIFALGLTVIEAAGSGPLPKNGEEWHEIRRGIVPRMPLVLNRDLTDLITSMIHPDPQERPTAIQVLQHKALCPVGSKSKAELHRENEILSKQLIVATKCLKSLTPKIRITAVERISSRIIGKKINRSFSTTTF